MYIIPYIRCKIQCGQKLSNLQGNSLCDQDTQNLKLFTEYKDNDRNTRYII